MPSRISIPATLLASVFAVLVGAVLGVLSFGSAGAASGPVPGTGVLRLGSSWSAASGYDRYAYLVVGRSAAAQAAAQPGKSLVYHSAPNVNVSWDAGVPYSVASANGWLLRDAAGTLLQSVSYPDNYFGDVGNVAYQAEWARRVGDYLASVGADGAFLDDVTANVSVMTGGVFPAKYPTQVAWEDAMASFIAYVGSALKARGFYVLVNAGKWISGNQGSNDGSLTAQWWQRLGPSVSGFHHEYYMQNPTNPSQFRGEGPAWYDNWSAWSNLITVAQNMGRDFVGLTYGSTSNVQAMRYVRASFLLFWNGAGGALSWETSGDPWSPEWTIDIGTPIAARYQVGVGWRREYTGGTVLANPSLSSSQTFSLGGTYLMPDGSSVTSVTLASKSGLILRSSGGGPAPTVPSNTAPPTISGTSQAGYAQTATTGTWSNNPTSYAFQWQRCDAAGNGCVAVAGATANQYQLGAVDVGMTVRVAVTASNTAGSSSATSGPSAVVLAAAESAPVNTAPPSISGTAQEDQVLTASAGSWSSSPTSYAYRWRRCAAAGTPCAEIPGATMSKYRLTGEDVAHSVRVHVTASNSGGTAAATSAPSGVVVSAPVQPAPVNTALPSIGGTAQEGLTLSASSGEWSNQPISYAYQWQRCDNGGNGCSAIGGATSTAYSLTSTDVGRTLRIVVTASNSSGSTSATSAVSAVIAAAPASPPPPPPPPGPAPVNSSLPDITGPLHDGKTASASNGSWSNGPTSFSYQWERCANETLESCVAVHGATASEYTFTMADQGFRFVVVVTATNASGSASATSVMSRSVH